jgi:hypothetical protein
MKVPVTVNDLLDGHVGLDLECLDRIYLNGYVPTLQTSGQVASFLTAHLGNPIASPALFEKIGTRFRADVRDYAARVGAAWIVFRKGDRKLDVVRPLLEKAARTGRSQVVAVGVAQEFQYVATRCEGGRRARGSAVVRVRQGRAAGDVLLLLSMGRGVRQRVHQDLRLLPVSSQDLDQRAVCRAAGYAASRRRGPGWRADRAWLCGIALWPVRDYRSARKARSSSDAW